MEKSKLKVISLRDLDYDVTVYDAGEDNLDNSPWWYLHGELEKRLGYDLGVIYNMSELLEDEYQKTLRWTTIKDDEAVVPEFKEIKKAYLEGIYPVEVYGIPEPCLGYFWVIEEKGVVARLRDNPGRMRLFRDWKQRGLVVMESDKEGNEIAKYKYENHYRYL